MSITQATTSLDKWQQKLEAHFKTLAEERQASALPVFAIEHELDSNAMTEIAAGLRSQLAWSAPLGPHWLLWVMYATEMGYDYDGEEFWSSFEKRTPNWRDDINRRQLLRNWFLKFHKTYAGLSPKGPWAKQFSIIAWPITHALLPKDLQTQLARVLYEQRYFVAEFIDSPAIQVGQLIAASAYYASSRLRNFLEQEELVGRIVLALLGSQGQDGAASVRDSTLKRIVADLEGAREARDWLHEARSVLAKARLRLVAKKQAQSEVDVNYSKATDAAMHVEGRGIRPHLMLIREGPDTWGVAVELPSFSGLAALSARNAAFLRSTRCTIAGTASAWNPKGWLLYGSQRKKLLTWPDQSKPIVRFEEFNEAIFHLLTTECRISAGPVWLFRVNGDGTASEVVGHQVRAGLEYVIVYTKDIAQSELLQQLRLSCDGIAGKGLNIPHNPSEEMLKVVTQIGLRLERTIRMWPVGLPPVYWDGESQIEWFHGDNLCLALSWDALYEGLAVHLDGGKVTEFNCTADNQTALLNLGQLPVGSHTLSLKATYRTAGTSRAQSAHRQTTLTILVRPPHRWIPGSSGHVGLIVSTDPHEPTLDGLLNGGTTVSIVGPEGRTITCGLELLDAAGVVLAAEPLGAIQLPMTADDWRKLIDARAQREIDPSIFLRASAGQLIVEADGLGRTRVPLRHAAVPIRWRAQGTKNIELQLVDDTGHEDPLNVKFVTFRDPTTPSSFEVSDASKPIRPIGHGGLYVAETGRHRAEIVVSVPGKVSLQDLADRPKLDFPLKDGDAVASLLYWLRDWSQARMVGPLATQRRAIVLRGMEDQLYETMCWKSWIDAERRYRDASPSDARAKEQLENAVHQPASFAVGLSRAQRLAITDSIDDSSRFLLEHAILYRICGDQKVCEAALRLAAIPEKFAEWAGPNIVKKLDALARLQPLLRGARMLVLLSADELRHKARGWPT